ncbi:plasmid stabilization protein [Haematobacter missouriensis]|jgi:antitoxin StbD|uniref:Plasmid stabilization protein n=1 Tax=Haematobacter missouriensis TaxID=366616 RepID=A0ABX3ZP21_9RHOB|nr:plasmid stabilization protein [Haematobacter missouriensis]KFI24599.1 plasmid stabilization protein [Haematobacter missouriensis]OWJ72000.1 plasmid stabilization protein [Haematobacter missouriensis]
MVNTIPGTATAKVTDLKHDPMGTVASGNGAAVAITNRKKVVFYCVPCNEYEAMLDRIEDAGLNSLAESRANSREIAVRLTEL